VAFCSCLEGSVGARGGEGNDFASPAELDLLIKPKCRRKAEKRITYTDNTPCLDRRVLGLDFLDCTWDLRCRLGRSTGSLEEITKSFSLLVVVRWVPLFPLALAHLLLGISKMN
jgi:hypothetical protein